MNKDKKDLEALLDGLLSNKEEIKESIFDLMNGLLNQNKNLRSILESTLNNLVDNSDNPIDKLKSEFVSINSSSEVIDRIDEIVEKVKLESNLTDLNKEIVKRIKCGMHHEVFESGLGFIKKPNRFRLEEVNDHYSFYFPKPDRSIINVIIDVESKSLINLCMLEESDQIHDQFKLRQLNALDDKEEFKSIIEYINSIMEIENEEASDN